MKKGLIFLTAIAILFLVMGIATAADLSNIKMPDGWDEVNDGIYMMTGDSPEDGGHNLLIQKFSDALKTTYYDNATGAGFVVDDKGNGTFVYTDEANKLGGSFEVVEIDGEECFINFWFAGLDSSEIDKTYGYMMEFNELNGFEPVEV